MKDELMSCKNNYVHEDKVQIAEHNMPSEENLISVTELFKVLGDPTCALWASPMTDSTI